MLDNWIVFLIIINKVSSDVSYNMPKFCPMTSWNSHAETLVTNDKFKDSFFNIFVNTNNTMYVTISYDGLYKMNIDILSSQLINIAKTSENVVSVFANTNDDINACCTDDNRNTKSSTVAPTPNKETCKCVLKIIVCLRQECSTTNPPQTDLETINKVIYKWNSITNRSQSVATVNESCFSLFVDKNNTIYCSLTYNHLVMKKFLGNLSNLLTVAAAGTGKKGSKNNELAYPVGIFVTDKFDLYVADFGNHRVQLFKHGSLSGSTIVINGLFERIQLSYPTGIVLDADGFLFIVDSGHHRIIGSGPNGFRCVVGCSERNGAAANLLSNPITMNFDSFGNIIVVDQNNYRIQRFRLATNSCVLSFNQPKFCPSATWSSAPTTLIDANKSGNRVNGLFVDAGNIVYISSDSQSKPNTLIEEYTNIIKIIPKSLYPTTKNLFVTINGDIYASKKRNNYTIKWTKNSSEAVDVIKSSYGCFSLFIDTNNSIYCSNKDYHRILKASLANTTSSWLQIVGNGGSPGYSHTVLNSPHGIFVNTSLYLYVADAGNNRIQVFAPNSRIGATVLINNTDTNLKLSYPIDITIDADGYLFILNRNGRQVIGSSPNGFRCLVGCHENDGQNTYNSQILQFDSYGNMFVLNNDGNVQTYKLLSNSCNESTTTTTSQSSKTSATSELSSTTTTTTTTTSQSSKASTSSESPSTTTTTSSESSNTSTITSTNRSHVFIPLICNDTTPSGMPCKQLESICKMTNPCRNNGSCIDNDSVVERYICQCLPRFNGSKCENDLRVCQVNPCWHNGTCNDLNTTFNCSCPTGWTGQHCELLVDFCANETCQNNAICRPSFRNFTCECLGENYSGRHCEIVATKIKIYKIVSKSFAYVGILAICIVIGFIIVMDILKYGFGIDPVEPERQRLRRQKLLKRHKPVIQRFVYINTPPSNYEQ